MTALDNPERSWEPPAATRAVDRDEICARLGVTDEPFRVLSGGLANVNVLVGERRVLRIGRRDPAAIALEAALLTRPWESFRVPALLASGSDFVVTESLRLHPLSDDAGGGELCGRALAEIHETKFAEPGFLSSDARSVARSLGDVVSDFTSHVRDCLTHVEPNVRSELEPGVLGLFSDNVEALRSLARAPVLLHGDYKPSNLFVDDGGRLVVLDWEFAYAGPALMDAGQLFRWRTSQSFADAFAQSYRAGGGILPDDWQRWARIFDVVNLVGLLAESPPDSRRARDLRQRIRETLEN